MITSEQAKNARLQLGISQNLVSKTTGLSRPYLSNFESDKFNPNNEFKETLKAFYIKEGITFDNELSKEIEPTKEDNHQIENNNLKLIDGIQIDTTYISINKAQTLVDDIGHISMDLLTLDDGNLPIKEGLFFNSIDTENIQSQINETIKKMAIGFLQLLELKGENNLSMKAKELPNLEDITIDDYNNYSISDYLSYALFSKDNN